MRKILMLITVVSILILCLCFDVSAKDNTEKAVIPDYQIIIDDSLIYYADSIYPFLNYKGITYFPMTYEYTRAMNLTTGWLDGTAFMVAYQPSYETLPIYGTTVNEKYNTVVVPDGYNTYVNAKKVDNKTAEYPLLNFRGVTYFPLTWDYAVEEFGWQISFVNNILRINTDNNTDYRWTLIEKRKDDVVLKLYYGKEILSEDGSIKHDYIQEWYSLDYNTGALVQLNDYTAKVIDSTGKQVDVAVNNGYVYFNGQKLDDIYIEEASNDYMKPSDVQESGYTISAFVSDAYEPLEVVDIRVNTYKYGENANWGQKSNYTFIKSNNNLISLGMYKTVENVYELDGNIYFNTVDYVQTTFRHYLKNRRLWKLSTDGKITEISYGDYNSIIIIGKANNKLYLKCIWSPENNMEDYAPYSVSLVNDGYYTFDGEGIRFISPYIYSDFDIVSKKGDVFAVNNVLDKITKCEIKPKYY